MLIDPKTLTPPPPPYCQLLWLLLSQQLGDFYILSLSTSLVWGHSPECCVQIYCAGLAMLLLKLLHRTVTHKKWVHYENIYFYTKGSPAKIGLRPSHLRNQDKIATSEEK